MSEVNYVDMVAALTKPGDVIAAEITPQEADLWHVGTGAMGEAVEILEAHMEALIRHAPLDLENVLEELGDMEFYLEGIRTNLGITYDETTNMIGVVPSMGGFPEACTLVTVVGSLFDAIKKIVIYKKDGDRLTLVALLASIEMVMDNIRNEYGMTRDATLAQNISKLSVRYAGLTYSNEAAQTRADKA